MPQIRGPDYAESEKQTPLILQGKRKKLSPTRHNTGLGIMLVMPHAA